ncbi:MAG: MarR family winged helix-turn-helix transcriptional regulator [Bilifractor sp.]|jgi:DNA-binding MarR family transcriptional regulator
MSDIVHRIRSFNRFYLPTMNLLGVHYLGSEYSATEARVMFEIYEDEGCNAAHIAEKMKIDKSYLSRIINGYVKKGYIERKASEQDRRCQRLYLTEQGKERTRDFIQKSDADIERIVGQLSPEEEEELKKAFDVITEILSRDKGERS